VSKRVSKAEKELRLARIVKMLSGGHTRKDIVDFGKQSWNVSVSMMDKYMSQAWKEIEKLANYDKQQAFGKAISDLSELYRRALDNDDVSVALSVRKELSDLLGIKKTANKQGDLHIHLDSLPDEITLMLSGIEEKGKQEELELEPTNRQE
jgi:hypothetical protein